MDLFVIIGLISYFFIINLVGAILMASDKRKSQKRRTWRISENTLMMTALLGGATSMFVASKSLRHKTKKWKFRLGLPLFMACHLLFVLYWI
ncbi:DUF1294 domain-containing protein [Salipaludibacillus sp. HK11]|uniref:DUF1294 domain-containing protein n=1 Tax=Salipaludibacillus sp. HK11 TaxID=3394320 RepID=UPI0039FD2544